MDLALLACGWLGQAAFAWRTLAQWLASERAGRTVIPAGYWPWSIVGTVLTLAYCLGRADAVFVLGALAMGAIFVRNAFLDTEGPATGEPRSILVPLLLGLAVFAALAAYDAASGSGTFRSTLPLAWSVVGFLGQSLWSGRYVVQWIASERRGQSVLPASFFGFGLLGSVLLTAYALRQSDLVNVAAYVLNPIPYGRNLAILLRHRNGPSPGGD